MSAALKQYPTAYEVKEGYTLIKLEPIHTADYAREFKEYIAPFITETKSHVVVDFTTFVDNPSHWVQTLMILSRELKKLKKSIRLFGVSENLANYLKRQGVDGSLKSTASLKAALVDLGLEKPEASAGPVKSFDVNLVNPFIQATVQALKVQGNMECKPGKPQLLQVNEKKYDQKNNIAGVITLETTKVTGSITLIFPEKVFLAIFEAIFGEKHESLNAEVQDAAAEILNIIYGIAKVNINEIPGYDLQPSIPTVISGDNINVRQQTKENIVVLPFSTDIGSFQMEILLNARK